MFYLRKHGTKSFKFRKHSAWERAPGSIEEYRNVTDPLTARQNPFYEIPIHLNKSKRKITYTSPDIHAYWYKLIKHITEENSKIAYWHKLIKHITEENSTIYLNLQIYPTSSSNYEIQRKIRNFRKLQITTMQHVIEITSPASKKKIWIITIVSCADVTVSWHIWTKVRTQYKRASEDGTRKKSHSIEHRKRQETAYWLLMECL